MFIKKFYYINLSFLILGSCSTASVRLMPQEDGTIEVVARDIEKEGAEEAAIDKAEDYCKKMKKNPVYAKEETKYEGQMDEEKRKMIKRGSNAAIILGGAGAGMGETGLGGVLGSAGMVGHTMTNGRDYTTKVRFRCQ